MNNELYLRAMGPEDLDVLYQVENDRELWNVGVTNVPYSRQALQHFIANTTYDIYTDKQVRMLACVNQQVIGICLINNKWMLKELRILKIIRIMRVLYL